MDEQTIARVYLLESTPEKVVIQIPSTNYQLHLRCPAEPEVSPQGRVRGIIHCNVWKVDLVSPGGAYIEPIYGRPRRVQGRVIGHVDGSNALVVSIRGCPIVADLTDHWVAKEIPTGTLVGLDVYEGASFEPKPLALAGAAAAAPPTVPA
ncbi:MAG: hypothetical protein WD294_08870 [Phycisphaeraceae bacterium]